MMTDTQYTQSDVDRVTALLDAPGTAWDSSNIDTEGMAHDILAESTQDGYEGGLVTPLHYRITFGFDAFHDLLEVHTYVTPADQDKDAFHLRDTADGLELTTPHGVWVLDDAQAANLAGFLSSAVSERLYRQRELRRPTNQTAELAAIGDTHA